MTPLNIAIHRWTLDRPGTFEHRTYDGVLALAHEKSGIDCTVDEFREELKRCGREPEQRGRHDEQGYYWILTFHGHGITRASA